MGSEPACSGAACSEPVRSDPVIVGRIAGAFGVQGWVRVEPYTVQRDTLLALSPWRLQVAGEPREAGCEVTVQASRPHGRGLRGLVVKLDRVETREDAGRLHGAAIAVPRERLPEPAPGEHYWVDLLGLSVVTGDGADLGRVERLMETGANDVLVVRGERERLIPFVEGQVVLAVDREVGLIRVDWDPDF